jgi:HlyD family secretion protein
MAVICGSLLISRATAAVSADEDVDVVKAVGTLEPIAVVVVSPQVSGTLVKFGEDPNEPNKTIDYGSAVKKGTVLAQIDPTSYRLEFDRAKANVDKAEAGVRLATAQIALAKLDLQRATKRVSDKTADELEVEHAQAAVDVAQAALAEKTAEVALQKTAVDQAELNVANCTIRSPVDDGVVVARRCEVGQTIAPRADAPSMFLVAADIKKMQLWLSVGEHDIGKVAVGQPVRFTISAFPGKRFAGKVVQIRLNAQVNRGEVIFTVVADLDAVDERLLPYLTADAEIITTKRSPSH